MPATISIPRSASRQYVPVVTTWKHGQIVPIFAKELNPGDTVKIDLTSLIRANTPKAPFMGVIETEINAFWCPMRLLCTNWKKIWGENDQTAGTPADTQVVLRNNTDADLFNSGGVAWDGISAYLRKPVVAANSSKHALLKVFKEKMYFKTWSEFYRASMLQNPFIMSTADDVIGSLNGSSVQKSHALMQVNKSYDYFTECLTSPQFGSNTVSLPLGTEAPVTFSQDSRGNILNGSVYASADSSITGATHLEVIDEDELHSNVVLNATADLSQATAASIIQLRYAAALQRFQELSNFGGSLYFGQLLAHFGVTPADKSLQRVERVGTIVFDLNVSQVTAMADTTINGQVSPAGSVGAVSVTGNKRQLCVKGADEHGIIMILMHTRVKHNIYTQGVLREDTRVKRTDYPSPEFFYIGDMAVYKKEIFVTGDSTDDEVFGYQSNNADINFPYAYVTGLINPDATGSLGYWALTSNFASRPSLSGSFLEEDRNAVASRLITGTSSSYDYVGEFGLNIEFISEVPVNPLPGKMDHVGLY